MLDRIELFQRAFTNVTIFFRVFGLQFFTLTNSKDNRKCNHHGNEISTRNKISFAITLFILVAALGLYICYFFDESEIMVWKVTDCVCMVIIIFAIIQSYTSTPKAKKVFLYSEQIVRIFEESLEWKSDSVKHAASFKSFFLKSAITLLILLFVFSSLIYFLDYSRVKFIFVSTYLNIMILLIFLRFVLYISLVEVNLENIKKYFESISEYQNFKKHVVHVAGFQYRSKKISIDCYSALKEIYGLCWEIATFANQINGFFVVVTLIYTVIYNSVSGYVLYLFFSNKISFGLDVAGKKL